MKKKKQYSFDIETVKECLRHIADERKQINLHLCNIDFEIIKVIGVLNAYETQEEKAE